MGIKKLLAVLVVAGALLGGGQAKAEIEYEYQKITKDVMVTLSALGCVVPLGTWGPIEHRIYTEFRSRGLRLITKPCSLKSK